MDLSVRVWVFEVKDVAWVAFPKSFLKFEKNEVFTKFEVISEKRRAMKSESSIVEGGVALIS